MKHVKKCIKCQAIFRLIKLNIKELYVSGWKLGRFRLHNSQLTATIRVYYEECETIVPAVQRTAVYQQLHHRALDNLRFVQRPNNRNGYTITKAPLQIKFLHPVNGQIQDFQNKALQNIAANETIEINSPIKVLTFCTLDSGGAGIGSLRRIAALRRHGVDARLASLIRRSEFDYVDRLEPPLDGIDTTNQDNVWRVIAKSAIQSVKSCHGYADYEMFSLPVSCLARVS